MPFQTAAIVIQDAESGASAQIRPDVGFNCFSFKARIGGKPVEALWSEASFADGAGKPSRSGIPVLFPFGGRIKDARYRFDGVDYQITTAGDNAPNAIHGFVFNRRWRVIDYAANRVVGEFQGSVDAPETLKDWPSDYRIQLAYSVAGDTLAIEATVSNPGRTVLPFTFGLHPYFRLPLGSGSADADQCLVTIPAERFWPLDVSLPIGEERPVDAARDFRTPKPFREIAVDDILTGLIAEDGLIRTTVDDPAAGIRLTQIFPADYRFCIAYTNPNRESIAIEPYTGSPDPFRAPALGLDPHLTLLDAGQTWTSTVTITLSSI